MIDQDTLEVTEFPITDEKGEIVMIGKKRLMGKQAPNCSLLTLFLEGGGQLPAALHNQKFTNYKMCREVVGNYKRSLAISPELAKKRDKSISNRKKAMEASK